MRILRFIKRLILLVLVLVVVGAVAAIVWIMRNPDDARTWRQVTAIGSQLSDLGAVDSVGELIAVEIAKARTEEVGGLPATLVTPADGGDAHPAIVLLVPEGTSDSDDARVREVQHAVAGAKLSAWAIRVPSGDDALTDPATYEDLVSALGQVAGHETTEDRHVSVLAIGPTASLVLVAAASSDIARDIEAIVAVQPLADVRGLVALATTGSYVDAAGVEQRTELGPELRASAGRAILQAVRVELEAEPNPVLEALLDTAEASDDPLAALRVLPDDVAGPSLAPVLAVLRSETGAEFDAAWDQLPASFRDAALERSPLARAEAVRSRVLVVRATDDAWAAVDVERLASELPDARTLQLEAKDPAGLLDDPAALRDVLSVSEWWMRRAGA